MKTRHLIRAVGLVAGIGLIWAGVTRTKVSASASARASALKQVGVRFHLGVNDVDGAYVSAQWRMAP